MADEKSGNGSEGDPGTDPGGKQQQGEPKGGTPQQTAGAGGVGGPQGGAREPIGLNPDVLPKDLQGKSEAEIRFMLNQMVTGTKTAAKRVQELEQRLQEMESKPKEPEKPKRPYEERILDEPDAVIEEIVRERFGGTISELQKQTGEAAFAAVKQNPQFEDFGEYEDTIREMLEEANAPANQQNIMGAYTMAVGQKALEERQQKKREVESQGIERGGDPPPPKNDKPEIQGLEREIMIASGFSDEDDWRRYKNSDDVAGMIRVPTGERKKNDGE